VHTTEGNPVNLTDPSGFYPDIKQIRKSIYEGKIIFDNPDPNNPNELEWTDGAIAKVTRAIEESINRYSSAKGFQTTIKYFVELGITTSMPMELKRGREAGAIYAAASRPTLAIFNLWFDKNPNFRASILTHEMAHYWDQNHSTTLRTDMQSWINWGDPPTSRGDNGKIGESFAEAVRLYLFPELDEGRLWTDDIGAGLALAAGVPDSLRIPGTDKYGNPVDNAECFIQVQDRYDWLQLKFTGR
jgi:hypothetical protein